MVKHLIFDLDGTLVDCKDLHQRAFKEAVKKYAPGFDYNWNSLEQLRTVEKIKTLKEILPNLPIETINKTKEHITQELLKDYIKFDETLKIHIERLYKKYILSCASNASNIFVENILEILDIKSSFTVINSGNNFPSKPDPTIYNDCIIKTHTTKDQTIIFEDSKIGIQGAIATGSKVIQIKNSTHLKEVLKNY